METTPASSPLVKVGMHTPWGWADIVTLIAEGIGLVNTPSHGGMKLSPEMNKKVNAAWRKRGGWYEEDCEYAIVVKTFPEHFSEKDLAVAEKALKEYFPDAYETVTGTKVDLTESYVLRKRAFETEMAEKLVVVSASGDWHTAVPTGMVGVVATKGGKREVGVEEFKFLVPAKEYSARTEFGFVIADPSKYVPFTP